MNARNRCGATAHGAHPKDREPRVALLRLLSGLDYFDAASASQIESYDAARKTAFNLFSFDLPRSDLKTSLGQRPDNLRRQSLGALWTAAGQVESLRPQLSTIKITQGPVVGELIGRQHFKSADMSIQCLVTADKNSKKDLSPELGLVLSTGKPLAQVEFTSELVTLSLQTDLSSPELEPARLVWQSGYTNLGFDSNEFNSKVGASFAVRFRLFADLLEVFISRPVTNSADIGLVDLSPIFAERLHFGPLAGRYSCVPYFHIPAQTNFKQAASIVLNTFRLRPVIFAVDGNGPLPTISNPGSTVGFADNVVVSGAHTLQGQLVLARRVSSVRLCLLDTQTGKLAAYSDVVPVGGFGTAHAFVGTRQLRV